MATRHEEYEDSEEDSYESGEESYTEDEDESEEEEEEEALLKYRRFAKDVVNNLSKGGQPGENRNVIQCMAVHPKVIHVPWTICFIIYY